MELSEMQRLKQIENENPRLKQIMAEQTLEIQALKAVIAVVRPIVRRDAVVWLQTRGTSLRQACRLISLSTSTWRSVIASHTAVWAEDERHPVDIRLVPSLSHPSRCHHIAKTPVDSGGLQGIPEN
jgi:hypothetical protein